MCLAKLFCTFKFGGDGVQHTAFKARGTGGTAGAALTRVVVMEEETGACRDYDDFFSRTRYTVPEGVLDENGRMEAFNNDLVIRCLDRMVVKDDGYEVAFKAGVTVEVEV